MNNSEIVGLFEKWLVGTYPWIHDGKTAEDAAWYGFVARQPEIDALKAEVCFLKNEGERSCLVDEIELLKAEVERLRGLLRDLPPLCEIWRLQRNAATHPDLYRAIVNPNQPGHEEVARRLVACWNACEPHSTEDLEKATADEWWSMAELRYARKRNIDLVRALRFVMPYARHVLPTSLYPDEWAAEMRKVDALLDKYPEGKS